jgi:hypothetical protein
VKAAAIFRPHAPIAVRPLPAPKLTALRPLGGRSDHFVERPELDGKDVQKTRGSSNARRNSKLG